MGNSKVLACFLCCYSSFIVNLVFKLLPQLAFFVAHSLAQQGFLPLHTLGNSYVKLIFFQQFFSLYSMSR